MNCQQLIDSLKKYKDFMIIVEGKKDKSALTSIGFNNIFVINETGKSIYERVEQIEEISKKRKVCILTDFDKKGNQLYFQLQLPPVRDWWNDS